MIKNLVKRGFEGHYCESSAEAIDLVMSFIEEGSEIGWGGTMTFFESGVKDALEKKDFIMLDRSKAKDEHEIDEIYHKHLNCDTYFMSCNAITTKGELVNIDGNSNRLSCLLYGPKQIIMLVGMNKVVRDIEDGVNRIQTLACPPNAARLGCQTPCGTVGICGNCHHEDCMCCNIVVSRHNRHAGRIKVILIAEDLGY